MGLNSSGVRVRDCGSVIEKVSLNEWGFEQKKGKMKVDASCSVDGYGRRVVFCWSLP